MTFRGAIVVAAFLAVGGVARAQDGGVGVDAAPADADLSAAPRALTPIVPAYTPEAQKLGVAGDVVLLMTLDEAGQVTDVAVESGLPAGLTESAVAAARAAKFEPARDRAGRGMAVRIRWVVHFTLPEVRKPATTPTPPPTPTPTKTPERPDIEHFEPGASGTIVWQVRERGTGKVMPGASIWIEDTSELLHVDARGRVERTLPPGAYAIVVRAPGHEQEERLERLHAGEHVERTYFVLKNRLSEYETLVLAAPARAETGVVTLQADEIHSIPGTFGDPFRAVMLLPGVASFFSGLGYPIIRGEAPGQTGTFVDDVKVPLLYHLGFGPAVIHPLYLDALDFHPGNFPPEFGRFTGGLIRARTTAAPTEPKTMLEADLFKLSAFHARPFTLAGHDGAISAAARYGTFAFLARAIDPNAVLTYWDFQTRADLRAAGGAWRLLVFGASDAAGTKAHETDDGRFLPEQVLRIGFVRADLRYRLFRRGRWSGDAGVEVGPDFTNNTDPGNPASIREWVVRPRAAVDLALGERLKLRGGADMIWQTWNASVLGTDFGSLHFPTRGFTYGTFAQAEWQPTPAWLVAAGLRFDMYDYRFSSTSLFGDAKTFVSSVDPRLAIRRRLRAGLYLKGGIGFYHSPPRFLVPWPGLEGFGLAENGLNESLQGSIGAEAQLPHDISIDGQVYANWLPKVSEFGFDEIMDMPGNNGPVQTVRKGRAYGLELIGRRRLGNRLFGWFTYTLARSERDLGNTGWRPSEFDQTHLINAIVSYALGRAWTVSATFHYNTGRPVTPRLPPEAGQQLSRAQFETLYDTDRLPNFWRVDARVEKREAFDTWYLDFYVDWFNISLQKEVTGWEYRFDPVSGALVHDRPQETLLTIPTMGLRVEF